MFGFAVNNDDIVCAIQSLEEYKSRKQGERGELDYKTQLIALQAMNEYLSHRDDISDVDKWRYTASLYGIDVKTMLALAKSQIKTSASNIKIWEDMNKLIHVFDGIPNELPKGEVEAALIAYDGDSTKPYCDLVYSGLRVIRDFYKLQDIVSEYKTRYE